MKQLLIDIEVYPNYFLLGCMDYKTDEITSFEISEKIDQRLELYKFLKSYNGFWISFNGIHYDNVVLAFGQSNKWFNKLSTTQCLDKLKLFSDSVIYNQDDPKKFSKLKYYSWSFTNIDLFLYWSKLLRLSKKISLKGLGIQMGYSTVQELPYDSHTILTLEQIEVVKNYNLQHDLGILHLLTKQFDGKGRIPIGNLGTIQLRQQVVKKYGINAWSMDGPKIASEVLLDSYCNLKSLDVNEVRRTRFDKTSILFKDLFKDLNINFKTVPFINVYNEWCNARDTFSKEFVVGTTHPLKLSVGVGGIHSINNNEIYESDDEYIIVTDDIAAMYPTNIENWKAFRFPEVQAEYSSFKQKRITETKPGMKANKKGSPKWTEFFQQDLFYKLILNGVSGLLDMEHSWLYNPEKIMKVRCGGQLILLTLIELCIINDIEVISANTDGIEVRMKRSQYDLYLTLVKQVEQQFNVIFEREIYKKIIYSNVNSYLAIFENGNTKKKGQFITNPELGSSCDFLVIPKCLEQYFIHGIKPEEILANPEKYNLGIFDFCASKKADKSYTVEWNGQTQQRLNRYYVSRKGGYLYKCRDGKKSHMLKGWGVMLYNNHEVKPVSSYKLDMRYYLSEVNKLISELENHNQTSLLNERLF